MATLKDRTNGKTIVLKSHHVFGRNKAAANTILTGRDVSQIHASIRWTGQQWEVLDHSRNGTWVNTTRLQTGQSVPLQKGNLIRFGSEGEPKWELLNLDPPGALLVPLAGDGAAIDLRRLLVLPNENNPEISIFMSEIGQWVCEQQDTVSPLHDGDIVRHGRQVWQFSDPGPIESTVEGPLSECLFKAECGFSFCVSLDEEHVFLNILQDDKVICDLGERVHHYLLLTLARQRLKDARHNADPSSQGWVAPEQLSEMLRIDPNHLNIQIYRARKQISQALPEMVPLPQAVERRVGGLRFGFSSFQIIRGTINEGAMFQGKVINE